MLEAGSADGEGMPSTRTSMPGRPRRIVLAAGIAALLVLAGCGSTHQKSLPFNEHNLLAESAAASSHFQSARVDMVMTARIGHSAPLPAGMSGGPFAITMTGAVGGVGAVGQFNLNLRVSEPGATIAMQMRSTGKVLYARLAGGQWYSVALNGPAANKTQKQTKTAKVIGQFLRTHEKHWLIDVGARRAGAKDILAGDLDYGAITTDLTTLMTRLHLPPSDASTIQYVTKSIRETTWSLTFDHKTHRLESLHAKAELGFDSEELKTFGLPMPFGLPYQVTGITGTLAVHISHWGVPVHLTAPAHAIPLDLPVGTAT
jgi:hypothetical protein